MSFQWIFDNAETISVDSRPTVLQTITRNNTVRATNLGGAIKRYSVQLPAGIPYRELSANITAAETLGMHSSANVTVTLDGSVYATGNLICTNFPNWTLFGAKNINQVSWDGPFEFYEVINQ
jgi:hypothetical protein